MAEKIYVSGLDVIQKLYEKAKAVLEVRGLAGIIAARGALAAAIKNIEEMVRISDTLEAVRDKVELRDEDGDITSDFTHHNGEDGYWVLCWLFVYEADVRTKSVCVVCGAPAWLHPGLDPRHAEDDEDKKGQKLDDDHPAKVAATTGEDNAVV